MANDRLYIVCSCGAWTTMWKYWVGHGNFREESEEWIFIHATSCGFNGEMASFSLMWENQLNRILNLEKHNVGPPNK